MPRFLDLIDSDCYVSALNPRLNMFFLYLTGEFTGWFGHKRVGIAVF